MQTLSAAKAMTKPLGSLKLDFRLPVLQNTNMTENNVRTAFYKYYVIENNFKQR